jgi:hypothetical protein
VIRIKMNCQKLENFNKTVKAISGLFIFYFKIFSNKLVLSSFVDQIDTESFMHNFSIYVPGRTTRHMQLFVPTRARTDLKFF